MTITNGALPQPVALYTAGLDALLARLLLPKMLSMGKQNIFWLFESLSLIFCRPGCAAGPPAVPQDAEAQRATGGQRSPRLSAGGRAQLLRAAGAGRTGARGAAVPAAPGGLHGVRWDCQPSWQE